MILILGGTAEAWELAERLHARRLPVTTSLTGRLQDPRLPAGDVRIGGFGGPERLACWLRNQRVRAVIDATHPFAERISAAAVIACAQARVQLLRLEGPGWSERPGDQWVWADDIRHGARLISGLGARVFLTTGRQGLEAFAGSDAWFLIRTAEAPPPPLPRHHELIRGCAPFTLDGELELIDRHRIDLLITKDRGGTLTVAKLDAARMRGVPVIIIRRPRSQAPAGSVSDVDLAVAWACRQVRG
jgi:precorrin-6A/cobalt-precorrin-6A reductase